MAPTDPDVRRKAVDTDAKGVWSRQFSSGGFPVLSHPGV